MLRRLNDVLERSALAAVIAMMAVMCALTFAQAAGRYALHFSLTWSEELARFLMVWISMLGGAVAARRRMHVGFDALAQWLPAPVARAIRALGALLALATFAVMAWYGFRLASFNMLQRSAALEWPMGVPYAAIPVGALLLALFLFEETVLVVTGPAPVARGETAPPPAASAAV